MNFRPANELKPVCAEPGCIRTASAAGRCVRHYLRLRRLKPLPPLPDGRTIRVSLANRNGSTWIELRKGTMRFYVPHEEAGAVAAEIAAEREKLRRGRRPETVVEAAGRPVANSGDTTPLPGDVAGRFRPPHGKRKSRGKDGAA